MLSALEHMDAIAAQLEQRKLALLLDYDGTLTPIVRRPEDAVLKDEVRELLRQLAGQCLVAIVSGRDRRDVERMVGIDSLIYAGSHGFDIQGPDLAMQHEAAREALPELDEAERVLHEQLAGIDGARVERKRFAIAIHYREVADEENVKRVEQVVDDVRRTLAGLRKMGGKKIFELQPDVRWDKGQAVLWLIGQLGLDHDGVLVMYLGDDVTDEHAFRALRPRPSAMGVRVAPPESETEATYYLRDCDEVQGFLEKLLGVLRR